MHTSHGGWREPCFLPAVAAIAECHGNNYDDWVELVWRISPLEKRTAAANQLFARVFPACRFAVYVAGEEWCMRSGQSTVTIV